MNWISSTGSGGGGGGSTGGGSNVPAPPPQAVITVVARMMMGIKRGCGMVGGGCFFYIIGGGHCSALVVTAHTSVEAQTLYELGNVCPALLYMRDHPDDFAALECRNHLRLEVQRGRGVDPRDLGTIGRRVVGECDRAILRDFEVRAESRRQPPGNDEVRYLAQRQAIGDVGDGMLRT